MPVACKRRVNVNLPLTVFLLAAVIPYSSGVQQPTRPMAILSSRPHPYWPAPFAASRGVPVATDQKVASCMPRCSTVSMVTRGHPAAVRRQGSEGPSNQLSNDTQRYRCTSPDVGGRVSPGQVQYAAGLNAPRTSLTRKPSELRAAGPAVDSDQPVHPVPAEAMQVSLSHRDEETALPNPAVDVYRCL